MDYIGDLSANQIVYIYLSTNNGPGGREDPSSTFELDDIKIFKNDSSVERNSTSGISLSSSGGPLTGIHRYSIDTSDDDDPGFFQAGNDYTVILYPDETIDGQLVSKILAQFSIENRFEGSPVTLDDNATNNTIIAESNWNALRANHQVADSFGEHVLSNVVQWAGSSTIDSVSLTLFSEILLAYTTGRFRTDFPMPGNITFYKQDNNTVIFTMNVTASERNRI